MSRTLTSILMVALTALLFVACLLTGAVDISVDEVFRTLFASGSADEISRTIILEARLPMALAALCCGMALAAAGLVLQTTFANPLAGPSILGVSTGASLGVALLMMGSFSLFGVSLSSTSGAVATMIAAAVGAGVIILILLAFSSVVKSATMLLIAGIMIGYLSSAIISWLNFFAPAEEVKSYALWGMGSFMGVTLGQVPLFAGVTVALCLGAILMSKPLDALLLGDRYAASMGYAPKRTRTLLLIYSGALTAVATAYCGPVGFLGLAVPHIARICFRTASHRALLPATILTGGATGLLCAWLCVLPSSIGVLPLSAVTPIIGVPVILYVILRPKKAVIY